MLNDHKSGKNAKNLVKVHIPGRQPRVTLELTRVSDSFDLDRNHWAVALKTHGDLRGNRVHVCVPADVVDVWVRGSADASCVCACASVAAFLTCWPCSP